MFRRQYIWVPVAIFALAGVRSAVAPPVVMAASEKEMIQELQRDMAVMQDMMRTLQRTQDDKFAALLERVQQALNASNDANRAVAVIQSSVQQNMREQGEKVTAPVVGLSKRMDDMSGDVRTLGSAMQDLTTTINRIQTQLTDINNALKVMQSPAPAPPPPTGGAASGAPEGAGTPPMPATDLFNAAERDRTSGNYQLALEGFQEYLKYYDKTDRAPEAQYKIASILYGQGKYEAAAKEFDVVLEKYPDASSLVAQSFWYKGQSLLKTGQRTAAKNQFLDLIKQQPDHELAKRACRDELPALGVRCPSTAPAKSTRKTKK